MCQKHSPSILLATHNSGKIQELEAYLAPLGFSVTALDSYGLPSPIENGGSFEANALIKAIAAHQATGLPCLADDSGLEVEYLQGAPGVETSSYGGWKKLLDVMTDVLPAARKARFVCVLAFVRNGHPPLILKGFCNGSIASMPSGEQGFGYDPVFIPAGENRTFAQMTKDEKSKHSHRGQALKNFSDWLMLNKEFIHG